MDFPASQLDELRRLSRDMRGHEEAGFAYFFLPQLILPEGCEPASLDSLLCPMPREGYSSRLFFASQVKPAGKVTTTALNWNATSVRILERNWHAYSWRTPLGLSLVQMVAIHLKALQ
jgi:hypothetical protein